MADTYTPKTGLAIPANHQRGWATEMDANLNQIDAFGAIGPLAVALKENPSASLNVTVAAGTYRKVDNTVGTYSGTTSQALTASATNYLYLTDSGTLTINTTGFPSSTNLVRLATVVTGTATVTSITDARIPFQSYGSNALSLSLTETANTILAGPTSGAAAVPTFRAMVAADMIVFTASGASHAAGAVPDPGVTAGTTRYLREDATWVAPPGTGTVTSVALTMPGVMSVSGSPITTSGTLAVSLATQTANTVWAGPTSGGVTTPTFRALVGADIPPFSASGVAHSTGGVPDPGVTAGTTRYLREDSTWATPAGSGTVTSVALTTPAEISVAGSPITSSGTLALTWANEAANKVLAGPTTGASTTPAFRLLVGADIPPFSASGVAHSTGGVPDPGSSAGSTRYLREDATWATPAGSGTVTSVALTTPAWLTVAGSPITSAGTLAITANTQNANYAMMGPASGAAAAPAFRALVAADYPIFVASGLNHSAGGVPDPGPTPASPLRFLREDATWAAAGSVSSVAITMPGEFSVTGSPITTSGTLAVTKANQSANLIYAGPSSGAAAAPTFRALVGADIPPFSASGVAHSTGGVPDPGVTAGTTRYLREDSTWATPAGSGTVTSVALTTPAWLTVSGSPITGAGTLAVTATSESANTFLAGPTSGAAAVPTFRAMVAADMVPFVASGVGHAQGAVPDPGVTAGTARYLREDATWVAPPGTGTVTSVALTMPGEWSITGSPITGSGTLAITKANQSANTFYAGPSSGSATAPAFRLMNKADVPITLNPTTVAANLIADIVLKLQGTVGGSSHQTGDLLQFLDSTSTRQWSFDKVGRPVSGGTTPSHSLGSAAGTGAAVNSHTGNDTAGYIQFTTGTGTTSGSLITINFNSSWGSAPQNVSLTPRDATTAPQMTNFYLSSLGTSSFTISVVNALAISTQYSLSFTVMG